MAVGLLSLRLGQEGLPLLADLFGILLALLLRLLEDCAKFARSVLDVGRHARRRYNGFL